MRYRVPPPRDPLHGATAEALIAALGSIESGWITIHELGCAARRDRDCNCSPTRVAAPGAEA